MANSNISAAKGEAATGIDGAIDRATSTVLPAVDRAAASAHNAVDRAASVATDAVGAVAQRSRRLAHAPEQWIDARYVYVRENPSKALLIALAFGFVVGRLTGMRR